jgi:hypothetical protein
LSQSTPTISAKQQGGALEEENLPSRLDNLRRFVSRQTKPHNFFRHGYFSHSLDGRKKQSKRRKI